MTNRLSAVATVPTPGLLPFSIFDNDGGRLYVMIGGVLTPLAPVSILDLPANPMISPDGLSVAFRDFTDPGADSGVYVVPIDGSAASTAIDPTYRIYANGTGDPINYPSWRPDGAAVVFTDSAADGSYTGGTIGGRIVRADYPAGSSAVLWTPELQSPTQREAAHRPVYSPDGTMIAFFVSCESGGGGDFTRQGLWVMNADGSSPALIAALDTTTAAGGYGLNGTQAVWSNDSTLIAYTTRTQNGVLGSNLRKVQPDGSGDALVKASPDSNGVWIGWGAWKDDDSQILLARYEPASGNARFSLFYINPDGTGETEIRNGAGVNDGPFGLQNSRQAWRLRDKIYWIADNNPYIMYQCDLDGSNTQAYYDSTADGFTMASGVESN